MQMSAIWICYSYPCFLYFLQRRSGFRQFRRELDAAGELGNWEYDLDTYNHCIAVLQRYFTGNPSGLTERDARIYSHYLQTEHKGFVKLAEELAADR